MKKFNIKFKIFENALIKKIICSRISLPEFSIHIDNCVMRVINNLNEFHEEILNTYCQNVNLKNQNVHELKTALQLAFCVKLYRHFGCKGAFQYYNDELGQEWLTNVRSYEECGNTFEPAGYQKKKHIRRRREIRIEDVHDGKFMTAAQFKDMIKKNYNFSMIHEGVEKRIFNFLEVYLELLEPKWKLWFDDNIKTWKDIESADINFVPSFKFGRIRHRMNYPMLQLTDFLGVYFLQIRSRLQNRYDEMNLNLQMIHDRVVQLTLFASVRMEVALKNEDEDYGEVFEVSADWCKTAYEYWGMLRVDILRTGLKFVKCEEDVMEYIKYRDSAVTVDPLDVMQILNDNYRVSGELKDIW